MTTMSSDRISEKLREYSVGMLEEILTDMEEEIDKIKNSHSHGTVSSSVMLEFSSEIKGRCSQILPEITETITRAGISLHIEKKVIYEVLEPVLQEAQKLVEELNYHIDQGIPFQNYHIVRTLIIRLKHLVAKLNAALDTYVPPMPTS